MEDQNSIDYESIKKQALEQFRSGKSLTGKGGAFVPLFKQFVEAALEAEIQEHLSSEEQQAQAGCSRCSAGHLELKDKCCS